jgi:hypothetical protein
MRKKYSLVILASFLAITMLSGCTERVATGALIGGAAGAAVGSIGGNRHDILKGAAVGAAVGAAGAAVTEPQQ